MKIRSSHRSVPLAVAGTILAPTLVSLAGCGSSQSSAPPPPVSAPPGMNRPPGMGAPRMSNGGGMSTGKKVALLAGAAALYYMYKRHQNAQGQQVQYYQSKSTGRIYYRDPKTHQAIWVTPPQQPIQVPTDQAQEYSRYQGYDNQNTGQAWGGYENGQFAPGSERL